MTKCSAFGGKKNERTSFWGDSLKMASFLEEKEMDLKEINIT